MKQAGCAERAAKFNRRLVPAAPQERCERNVQEGGARRSLSYNTEVNSSPARTVLNLLPEPYGANKTNTCFFRLT